MDKDSEIIRDTFLIAGNHYFSKDVKDYKTALHQYQIAHKLRKTPLSAFMILSCLLKAEESDDNNNRIFKAVNDARLVAEMSVYDKEEDDMIHIGGELSETRFKLRKFLLEWTINYKPDIPEFISEINTYRERLDEFEKTVRQ